MKFSNHLSRITSVLLLLCSVSYGKAVKGEIVQQQLDATGNGHSLIRVWGSYEEMGYAHGYLLADAIHVEIASLKKLLGERYSLIKTQVGRTVFPSDATEEMSGIVSGLKSRTPSSTVDAGDLRVLNTYGDWGYTRGCRSHSCWGSYVAAPVKTLSTRRTDYNGTKIAQVVGSVHFLLCAYLPSQKGKIRWLNFGIPGVVISGTGVNEYGTIVSIHDAPETGAGPPSGPNVLTRSLASRLMMTVSDLPSDNSRQLDFVHNVLRPYSSWTGSFLNYYVPAGRGGVITSSPTEGFHHLRKPQATYYGGEVMVTSNEPTSGSTSPSDFTAIDDYYRGDKPKRLADHWGALDLVNIDAGAQLMSVEYRNRGDMTVWARARLLGTKTTPKIVIEWSDLFRAKKRRTVR